MTKVTNDSLDEYGMSPKDWEDIRKDLKKTDRLNRYYALKAIWFPQFAPKTAGRGDEFNIVNGIKATIGIILNRVWTEKYRYKERAKPKVKQSSFIYGLDIAYWDSNISGYGYSSMAIWLYPNCRIEIFSDGESYL